MIIRREVFGDIGLLDEGYYTYFDDIDFCFNARKSGWPTWYVPASRVVHLVGQSTGITSRPKRFPPYVFEARRRYFLKNHSPQYAALDYRPGVLACHLGQHHVTGLTLDQGRDVGVVRPGQQIALPMARHRPIFSRRRSLTD